MDAWGMKSVADWQAAVTRQFGADVRYISHRYLSSGLWADVIIEYTVDGGKHERIQTTLFF